MTGFWKKWHRPDHTWPKYLPGGRLRTSTAVLVIVFAALTWVYQTYQPPVSPTPETQVVPPGFVPDPEYTWVPRTQVRTAPPTTTLTTTPTTSETSPTTSPETPTDTTGPDGSTPPELTLPNPFGQTPATTPTVTTTPAPATTATTPTPAPTSE
ncbi:hypothetical protein [Mycolicibacterium palauense]|uniref:hypothetical protein n=1 Tax=Mycolicibacterium palauense TaxID=2034511 RepID=UPI000BFEDF58|nr:hypothetical protein [Mycolicibacterium palauense]